MLRGWDDPKSPFENAPESANGDLLSPNEAQQNNQSPEQSGQDAAILREWTEAGEEDEDEDGCDEICTDPLTPTESVGTWSIAPGAVDRNSFNIPYDYDNGENISSLEYTSTSPRAGRSSKTSLNMSKDEIDQPVSPGSATFDDIDLEALADTLPSPSSNHGNNNRRCKGAWTKRFLYEIRTNSSFKLKLIIGGSVVMVATCLVAIAVTLSSGKKEMSTEGGPLSSIGDPVLLLGVQEPTYSPTILHSATPSNSPSSKSPTASPSYVPTFEPTFLPTTHTPTANPTSVLTTASPSMQPTSSPPTYVPTYSPTVNCADTDGRWMTYNDKPRDCAWLDNNHNGAESTRKDLNCLDSELGEKCRYTCRLYNGCIDYLLSSISDFIDADDISIGDACADKEGFFLSDEGIPRNCAWMDEDPSSAPMKKNLNCGTPDSEQTELGVMCPATCAGYNECQMTESGEIVRVAATPTQEDLVDSNEDGGDGNTRADAEQQNPMIRLDDLNCEDEDGLWLNHMGKYRQCRWFFTDEGEVAEKQNLNCGITELGQMCKKACECGKLNGGHIHSANEEVTCGREDEEGDWETHDGRFRQCRWLDYDGEIIAEAKKRLNCGQTELGHKCMATCGCDSNAALKFTTACEDGKGEWMTHERDVPRTCEWMDRKSPGERRELNCGKTEIGVMCQCKCSEPIDSFVDISPPETGGLVHFADVLEDDYELCEDEGGDWETHDGRFRQCRWLNLDNAVAKKLLNCGGKTGKYYSQLSLPLQHSLHVFHLTSFSQFRRNILILTVVDRDWNQV